MKSTTRTPTFWSRLATAMAATAVLAIAQRAEATSFPVEFTSTWPQSFFPVPAEQRDRSIEAFYTTETDIVLLERVTRATGLSANDLEIVNIEPGTWSNGCLGIQAPNSFCTQALVNGWYVEVSDGEQSWAYHTAPRTARLSPLPPVQLPAEQPRPPVDWMMGDFGLCITIFPAPSNCGGNGNNGLTQDTPWLPEDRIDDTWIFDDVPTGRWFDPPMASGFHYAMTEPGSLFTDILDFPDGIDSDNLFTVTVGDQVLGAFGPGQRVDFTEILGMGVQEFVLSGIDPLVDASDPLAFPAQNGALTPPAPASR
ncbi:MAG: hypothetical protein HC812_18570 [Leptolyngbya sp. RL_3_1]|nr:hypothetical protein [Leptolyngbya sp. RL_3_1]